MSGPTNYQWVITSTNYDGTAAPKSLRFDGIDDYLNLPYMGLYANGSASVILPMSSSDVTGVYSRIIAETSTVNANVRYIIPREDLNTAGTDLSIVADDTTGILSSVAVPFSKEVINVRSYVDSGDAIKTYSDSSEKQSVSYSRSGKTLTLNSTLIGAQATPTVVNAFAAIKLYGLIITKSALSNTDRGRCEQFLASRLSTLGVTLS